MTPSMWLAIHFGPKRDWDWLWIELRITPDIESALQQVLDGNITFMDALVLCAARLYAIVVVDELLYLVGERTEANLAEAFARWFMDGR